MTDFLERIREFFRENPRMWIVLLAALAITAYAVWTIYGGFSFGIGRFFAAPGDYCTVDEDCAGDETCVSNQCQTSQEAPPSAPTANISVSPSTTTSGGTVNVAWSSTNATSCTTTAGTFSTGGQPNGTTTDTISSSFTGVAEFRIRCTGPGGAIDSNIARVTVTAGGGGGGGGGIPEDPTGACKWREQFNAPEGMWFCEDLKCALAGNPPFEPTDQRKPPEGPASKINVHVMGFRVSENPPNPEDGPFHLVYKLDSTPKCGNGKECYPPKDPLWSCTRTDGKEVNLGRNGHDYYDCYNPLIHLYDTFPVTCCANTGLPGDCLTFQATAPAGSSPAPSPSLSPSVAPSVSPSPSASPTPSASVGPSEPVECAPVMQTVKLNQIARLEAAGGNGTYKWTVAQGGTIREGGNEYIGVSFRTVGEKTLRVTSGGSAVTCQVEVTAAEASATPSPEDAIEMKKSGRNMTVGDPAVNESVTAYPGQTVQFTVRIKNNGEKALNAVKLSDTLPAGMSYRDGSTIVGGRTVATNVITTAGLILGRLDPDEEVTVQWSAVADRTAEISSGPNRTSPVVRMSSSELPDITAAMSVTVYGSGTATGAGEIPTGPGGALLAALLTAAVMTLLYSGYTRSDAYRRHEAEAIGQERDPLDFRS